MRKIARNLSVVALLALTVLATGCSTAVGLYAGLDKEPMNDVIVTKSDFDPRTGENPPNAKTYWAIADLATALGLQISWQKGSTFEAAASGAVPAAGIGAASGATTAAVYGGGVAAAPLIAGNAINMGGGYALNGVITAGYSGAYGTADSLEKAMEDYREGRAYKAEYVDHNGVSLFRNVHVSAAFTRTRNTTAKPAPKLAEAMNFSGDRVGEPKPRRRQLQPGEPVF